MRQKLRHLPPPRLLGRAGRVVVLLLAMLVGTGTVSADSRSAARAHYLTGQKLYNTADYHGAIREFSAAQQLFPADLNNYNLALCYDKLGDPEPAIQYYKAYLSKVPATDKRAEIEASMSRLDAAAKSASAKRAEELRKADEARKAEEAKRLAEESRLAEQRKADAAKKLEEARRAEAERLAAEDAARRVGSTPDVSMGGGGGTPGSAVVITTGDRQLDRAQQINIDEIRDQRVGAGGSGIADPSGGPATAGVTGSRGSRGQAQFNQGQQGQQDQQDQQGQQGQGSAPPTAGQPAAPGPSAGAAGQPEGAPKATPVYKKWWFWAVVAVSAYVVYSIATEDSRAETSNGKTFLPPIGGTQSIGGGGATLMRF